LSISPTENCTPESIKVLTLTGRDGHHNALLNALGRKFHLCEIILENIPRESRNILKWRVRKLGLMTVLNQLALKLPDILLFKPHAGSMVSKLLTWPVELESRLIEKTPVRVVESVNSDTVRQFFTDTEPDIIVISGTSLLNRTTLEHFKGIPIINIHCGITPRYRGAHGAFWAIFHEDWENSGVTIHLVDNGIDTGGILAQSAIGISPDDNPRTLVLKQYNIGIQMMLETIEQVARGNAAIIERPDLDSRLHSSPTLTAWFRFRRNLKRKFSGSL
jgi:folate-dependent phosphoribosylglycinamide formyltransferase PurN